MISALLPQSDTGKSQRFSRKKPAVGKMSTAGPIAAETNAS